MTLIKSIIDLKELLPGLLGHDMIEKPFLLNNSIARSKSRRAFAATDELNDLFTTVPTMT